MASEVVYGFHPVFKASILICLKKKRVVMIVLAVYKSGTGTRGRGHRDACVGTWDLGTRDEGLEDIKYGTRGRVGRGRGDVKHRDVGDAGCE